MIIGISGKIGSGKDTVGKIIQVLCHLEKIDIKYSLSAVNYNIEKNFSGNNYYGDWHIKKFAFKLKQIVALLTGCTVEQLENQDFKNSNLPEMWSSLGGHGMSDHDLTLVPMKYRDMLQKVGTDAMRDKVHTDVWVNALFADYKAKRLNEYDKQKLERVDCEKDFPNWIITDMRFPNELSSVKQRKGVTIRLKRTQFLATGTLSTHEHPSETALDNAEFAHIIDNDGSMEELIEKVREVLLKESIV